VALSSCASDLLFGRGSAEPVSCQLNIMQRLMATKSVPERVAPFVLLCFESVNPQQCACHPRAEGVVVVRRAAMIDQVTRYCAWVGLLAGEPKRSFGKLHIGIEVGTTRGGLFD
jgi:hypothetical protein